MFKNDLEIMQAEMRARHARFGPYKPAVIPKIEPTMKAVHQALTKTAPVEWSAYKRARLRCANPENQDWADYGGRGIKFRFKNFLQFLGEVGFRPSNKQPSGKPTYSIHRINNDGNYEPGNLEVGDTKRTDGTGR